MNTPGAVLLIFYFSPLLLLLCQHFLQQSLKLQHKGFVIGSRSLAGTGQMILM